MYAVLIGMTGCGKSTAANYLARAHGFHIISSGDIARELTDFDPSVDSALNQGLPAPEEAIRLAVRKHIDDAMGADRVVLEGFPRTIAQLVALTEWLARPPVYVYLDCEELVCIERLIGRGRDDDNPDSIARKLESFRKNTRPVARILDTAGRLKIIDMERSDWTTALELALDLEHQPAKA